MRDLKPTGAELEFLGKKWSLLFTVNVIDEIQENFDIHIGELAKLIDVKTREVWSNVSFMLFVMINEQIEIENEIAEEKQPLYTDIKLFKRHVSNANLKDCVLAITNAYNLSFMKKAEGKSPNA